MIRTIATLALATLAACSSPRPSEEIALPPGDYEIYALEHIDASETADVLLQFFEDASGSTAMEQPPTVVADSETNSLILAGNPGRLRELRALLGQLDRPQDD